MGNTVRDKVAALGCGADDYIVQAGSLAELVARIRAALRRTGYTHDQDIVAGTICLRPSTRTVERDGVVLSLTGQEFDLLFCLAQSLGYPVTRAQLLQAVWGDDSAQGEATVTMCISRLRAKIEQNPRRPRHLKTIRGIGYALMP